MASYIQSVYKQWLMTKVLIDCWTVNRCAKYLGRDPAIVQNDFDTFLDEK